MNSFGSSLVWIAGALLLVACVEENSSLDARSKKNGKGGADDDTAATDSAATDDNANNPIMECGNKGRDYASFDNSSLIAARPPTRLGDDRGRMKPFSALQTEYQRVLGNTPASLTGAGTTFGQVPKMWFEETQASSVALQTAYNIAFDGCLTMTATDAAYAAAPDAASAQTQCSAMARKFWSKTPGPQEIDACVDMAVTGSAKETDPRRRWSYACASVLTAAGFLTY